VEAQKFGFGVQIPVSKPHTHTHTERQNKTMIKLEPFRTGYTVIQSNTFFEISDVNSYIWNKYVIYIS
jgi:hypothetical protein